MNHATITIDGYQIITDVIEAYEVDRLRRVCEQVHEANTKRRAGVRNLLAKLPLIAETARSPKVKSLVEAILGPDAFIVRAILFDKTAVTNWDVVWHQDTAIAVEERNEVPGYGPWSIKHGVPHVQPPASVLERMLTVRLHLDDCGDENGPLLVVPGSHYAGILPEASIDAAASERYAVACHTTAGGAVLMRPLLLHASKKASSPCHRRVIHMEFASAPLPEGLRWARR